MVTIFINFRSPPYIRKIKVLMMDGYVEHAEKYRIGLKSDGNCIRRRFVGSFGGVHFELFLQLSFGLVHVCSILASCRRRFLFFPRRASIRQ